MKSPSYYILEQALRRKKYIDRIINISDVVMTHVLLVHMYPESRDVNHWKCEILGHLKSLLVNVKSCSSEAKRSILYEYLLKMNYDSLDDKHMSILINVIDGSNLEYYMSKSPTDVWKENKDKIKSFYDDIIFSISHESGSTLRSIVQKL